MGLFKKQYCIDCGAACGITSPILGDETNVCGKCFDKNVSDTVREGFYFCDKSLNSVVYLQYKRDRKEKEDFWNRLRASDIGLRVKFSKLIDKLYVCEEYKLLLIGELPEDCIYSTKFDIYSIDEILKMEFMYIPGKKKDDIGGLAVIVTTTSNSLLHMLNRFQYTEKGISSGMVDDVFTELSDRYGIEGEWMQDVEIAKARIGRIKIMSKMERLAIPWEEFDPTREKALGLFMLDDGQPYDINYLSNIRNNLIKMYGPKPEIDQAYDYLLMCLSDPSKQGNAEKDILCFCPNCGHQNKENARFCENCGNILE